MAKTSKTEFACKQCDYKAAKWMGKCPGCGAWNTFVEEGSFRVFSGSAKAKEAKTKNAPMHIHYIKIEDNPRLKTTITEFDRVLGGGLVYGSLVLIGGEPGIGKSTLLTEVLGKLSHENPEKSILYVSGEESANQVAERAKRIQINGDKFLIAHETLWQNISENIQKFRPSLVVLDSIQTTVSDEIQSAPGTASQVREVTYELMNQIKSQGITCFVVGHITKEGAIAGPKILEHMVDTVIYFEGDQYGHYRILRAIKNRFGNTNEVGIFEMSEQGLAEVTNPSQYFLDDHIRENFGRSLSCILEGSRPLFVEIQALVIENQFGNGRRTTQGLDQNRLSMLVAVVEKYFDIPLGLNDIYVNVVGGIKLTGRESDLSIMVSLLSSYYNKPISHKIIFLGEVGLTGEVRSVCQIDARIKEIAQLKYEVVVTSEKTAQEHREKSPIKIIGIRDAKELEEFIEKN